MFADAATSGIFKNDELLPVHIYPTKFFNATFGGWKFTLTLEDPSFNIALSICCATLKEYKKQYEKEFIFAMPSICVEPNGTVTLRIGMMEKKTYKLIKEK